MSTSKQNSDPEYRVSIYSSKLGVPLNSVVHTYILTEHAGVINRYDVFAPFSLPARLKSYHNTIHKNLLPPRLGFLLFYIGKLWWSTDAAGWRWSTRLCSCVSGNKDSSAHALFTFIENGGLKTYPFHNYYRLIRCPNSNTFTQWIIDQFPECSLSLPWNAWGKGYRSK